MMSQEWLKISDITWFKVVSDSYHSLLRLPYLLQSVCLVVLACCDDVRYYVEDVYMKDLVPIFVMEIFIFVVMASVRSNFP